MMQVYEVLGTLRHATDVACEKIRELQVKVQEQAGETAKGFNNDGRWN